MGANTIVYVLVRREVGILAEGDSRIFELIEKVTTHDIGRHTPEIVLDTVVWSREGPSHLHLDGTVLGEFQLDCVCVRLEH
jgi:predicted nucleic acid-binding protein